MCKTTAGRFAPMEREGCGCSCSCPAATSVEDEIRLLGEHRKYIWEQAGIIDRKIASLKTAKDA